MFGNHRRGRQARNFTTNVPKILDLKSSSEQIFFRKLSLGATEEGDNKKREDGERGKKRLVEEDDYLKYFHQRGAIIRGTRLIEGRLLLEEIRCTH